MKEILLIYNFGEEEKRKLARALMPLKFRIREAAREDYGRPVGVLAGVLEDPGSPAEEAEMEAPMMVMAGLTGQRLDELLKGLRKAGLRIPYKAVLTDTNQSWKAADLLKELMREHELMTKR